MWPRSSSRLCVIAPITGADDAYANYGRSPFEGLEPRLIRGLFEADFEAMQSSVYASPTRRLGHLSAHDSAGARRFHAVMACVSGHFIWHAPLRLPAPADAAFIFCTLSAICFMPRQALTLCRLDFATGLFCPSPFALIYRHIELIADIDDSFYILSRTDACAPEFATAEVALSPRSHSAARRCLLFITPAYLHIA